MNAAFRILALVFTALMAGAGTAGAQADRTAPLTPGVAAPPRAAAPVRPQTPQQPAEDSDDLMPSLDDLSATRERPLFSSTRRPPEVAAPEAAPVTEAKSLSFELVGIVTGPDASVAILRNTESKEETRVARGEKYGNWTIDEVGDRFIIMSGEAKRVRVRLFDESKAAGIKVKKVGGDVDEAPAAATPDEDDKVDEEVEPSSSPEARPAAAAPQSPQARRDRRTRREQQRQRQPQRPQNRNDSDDEDDD
jgi:general secretion pathway protein N